MTTVLLVDDEPAVRSVTTQMLKSLGYQTIAAASGEEAVACYDPAKIDIVILDMVMPGMDGSETYDRLSDVNPGIITLLSSGYSIPETAERLLNRGCAGFLQKPYSITELSAALKNIKGKT